MLEIISKIYCFPTSDFDKAALNGKRTIDHSKVFASSGFYEGRDRYALDDMESLIFSMWYIAGIPLGEKNENVKQSEGRVLLKAFQAGKGTERVLVSLILYHLI